MVEIPESLLRRSAEAKAKALGVPVEQVLAEMRGEGPRVEPPQSEPEEEQAEASAAEGAEEEPAAEGAEEEPAAEEAEEEPAAEGAEEEPAAEEAEPEPESIEAGVEPDHEPEPEEPAAEEAEPEPESIEAGVEPDHEPEPEEPAPAEEQVAAAAETEERAAAVGTMVEEDEKPSPEGDGGGDGKVAGLVKPRPAVPPTGLPEGVRTQRLLTVVKARAIQKVRDEPTDKVNTWPHLMLMEFGALLAITALLVVMSVVIHSPLLDPANPNVTPNPSKAPWYFLGLQELLSYFDPQIAGVTVPTIVGLIGFMMIPYLDKNPSTRPSDRKFAILLYSIFLAGSATLTMFGVLFRGRGFSFTYPWRDGVFFDDLKDWLE